MQTLLGAGVLGLTLLLFLAPPLLRGARGAASTARLTQAARRGLMAAAVAVSGIAAAPALFAPLRRGLFAFCSSCPVAGDGSSPPTGFGEWADVFLLAVWHYAGTVLPVFVIACALSGLLIVRGGRLRPRGFLGSFALAAALPVCSCGVVPLARALMEGGGRRLRDGIVLVTAAPLLSPVIIFLGLAVLGPWYVALRVAASLAMASVASHVVAPLLPRRASGAAFLPQRASTDSALQAGWETLVGLSRYVLLGVTLGALVAATVPAGVVSRALTAGPLATAALVVTGVPINMCAGEEILISAPLVGAGLTMGQAVAFALAGAGICLGSIPLLVALLGRKGALALLALYLVLPFVVGLLMDLLPVHLH
jgi:uncharacterized membrane protein YraQ (UPF0718 family)